LQGGAVQVTDFTSKQIEHFVDVKNGWKGTTFTSPQKQKMWKKLEPAQRVEEHCRSFVHDMNSDKFKVTIN
jgi:phage-related protein